MHLLVLFAVWFPQTFGQDLEWGPPVHAAALMGSFGVVVAVICVEVLLHLLDALVELSLSRDAEVLVEEGPVQPLDEAVGLGPADLGGSVLDALELEEQLVRMPVEAAAVLGAVVAEHRIDRGAVRLEGRQHVAVHDVDRGDRELGGIEPPGRSGNGNR